VGLTKEPVVQAPLQLDAINPKIKGVAPEIDANRRKLLEAALAAAPHPYPLELGAGSGIPDPAPLVANRHLEPAARPTIP
jgi:hypothetical protein